MDDGVERLDIIADMPPFDELNDDSSDQDHLTSDMVYTVGSSLLCGQLFESGGTSLAAGGGGELGLRGRHPP